MKNILQKQNKVLRDKAKKILVKDINTPKIQNILKEMSASLRSQNDGVALAAPQIGYSLQIFIVSGKIFHEAFKRGENLENIPSNEVINDLVFINPKITKLSKEKEWVPEGCLSVRWLYGKTLRSKKASIEAYNEKGKKIRRGASQLLAQIFQHETDHLKGVLFIDHAEDIREELPK